MNSNKNYMQPSANKNRRYDIDWLRNLALLLLIFYHLGMYYVADWDWHIKSDTQSTLLQNFMVFSNLWRMNLLFFISGITLALVKHKYSAKQLINTRTKRLFLPLLFGMLLIVPIQVYYEFKADGMFDDYGEIQNFWDFMLAYVNVNTDFAQDKQSIIGLLTWNHLWYLIYLFAYTFVFLALRPLLERFIFTNAFQSVRPIPFFVIFSCYFLIAWVYIRPQYATTHALIDDWWSHAKYFSIMLMGYCFAHRKNIWNKVIKHRRILVYIGCTTYSLVALDRNGAFPFMGDAFQSYIVVQFAYGAVITLNMWCWMLASIGYVGRYLNKPSRLLNYANDAVLPWYILHQSLIILFAANIKIFDFSPWLEAVFIALMTIVSSYLLFEIIRRFNLLRLCFGLPNPNKS